MDVVIVLAFVWVVVVVVGMIGAVVRTFVPSNPRKALRYLGRPWRYEVSQTWGQGGFRAELIPRRRRGTTTDVQRFETALRRLHYVTARDIAAANRTADKLGLDSFARRRYLSSLPESNEFNAANNDVAEASKNISPWQERRVRAKMD